MTTKQLNQLKQDVLMLRTILNTEDNWIQSGFAKDSRGNLVSEYCPTAKSWCLIGAVSKVMHFGDFAARGNNNSSNSLVQLLYQCLPKRAKKTTIIPNQQARARHLLVRFNDDQKTTFKRVKNVIDRAAKSLGL